MVATAGYPGHAVTTYRCYTGPTGVTVTSWTAVCGVADKIAGVKVPFKDHKQFGRRELCRACFPAGWLTHHPDPTEIGEEGR